MPGWEDVDQMSVAFPCSNEGELYLQLHEHMNCQQINGRDYSSSLFGTGKATSGHCIWFEDPHCKGDINKQKQTQGGSSDGGWKTCIWGEGVRVARMQKQGLLSCRQGGTRVPRASPLAQGGPGDTVAKPCSHGYSESTGGTSTSCSTRHSPKETALPMQAGCFCPWRQP